MMVIERGAVAQDGCDGRLTEAMGVEDVVVAGVAVETRRKTGSMFDLGEEANTNAD